VKYRGSRPSEPEILLEVWRQLALRTSLPEALQAFAPPVIAVLGASALTIRSLDVRSSSLATVAEYRTGGGDAPRTRMLSPAELHLLLEGWSARPLHEVPGDGDAPLRSVLAEGVRSALVVPLAGDDELLGVLVGSFRAGLPSADLVGSFMVRLGEAVAAALATHLRIQRMATEREAAEAERSALLAKLGRSSAEDVIVGADAGLREVMERVDQVAASGVPVLVFGETGSGKEVVARAVHTRSPRAGGPFLRVNCGAIAPELVDSELFGHERGSFTGATHLRRGWFERSDGGTLFLDEVAELSLAAQVRLLQVLQDGTFERVGGQRPLRVDVRIVAATHRDLFGMVRSGRFREDLWYRLAVFPIELPSLRDRPEDMPALASHFAARAARRFGLPVVAPSLEQIGLLTSYQWPGNIRELAAVIDRAAILGDGRGLEIRQALGLSRPNHAGRWTGPSETGTLREPIGPLDDAVRAHIQRALVACAGRIEGPEGAARVLGVNPHTLRARMRRLGIDWASFRSAPRG